MASYNELLNQVQNLSIADQIRLLEELKKLVNPKVEVEDSDEVISAEEIAASETALQDYLAGRDRGISSKELKRKILGEKVD